MHSSLSHGSWCYYCVCGSFAWCLTADWCKQGRGRWSEGYGGGDDDGDYDDDG